MKGRKAAVVRLYQRLQWSGIGEAQRFLILSLLIGVFAGLLVVCFHVLIDLVSWSTIETATAEHPILRMLSPAIGGLAAALLVKRFFPAAAGSGVNDTKAAFYVTDGVVPFNAVVGKFLTCALSIGTGNSLGPEDPALHMGSGVASLLGRMFGLSRDRVRLIAPVGAAAGISAAFNTPITAVLFVVEEIIAGWDAGVLGSIVLSSVSAAVTLRWFLGNQPLFLVPQFEFKNVSELIVYAVIGAVGGVLSVLFVKAVKWLREWMEGMPKWVHYAKSAAAGLFVGIVGLWLPQVMGAGYGTVDNALHDRFGWDILLILGLAKVLATLACFSAGTPGGMFAPTLFIGAMVGGGIGGLAQAHWPFPTSAPSAYVLVGMGTFFAGVFRAPMTSIFMVFEVSASYVIILPVMVANTISYLVSRRLQDTPFFTMVAQQEGLELPSVEQQRESSPLRVENAMAPVVCPVLPAGTSVSDPRLHTSGDGPIIFSQGDGLWFVMTLQEMRSALQRAGGCAHTIEDILPVTEPPRLHPDMSLDAAMRLLPGHFMLPVSSRARPYSLLGVLTMEDVLRTYTTYANREKIAAD
ncbi:MAG TPA: chloride channel protein [Verrucomicrobiae bacterium]|nr:chloride channel protein [Verrucomicrobiae bacterium]